MSANSIHLSLYQISRETPVVFVYELGEKVYIGSKHQTYVNTLKTICDRYSVLEDGYVFGEIQDIGKLDSIVSSFEYIVSAGRTKDYIKSKTSKVLSLASFAVLNLFLGDNLKREHLDFGITLDLVIDQYLDKRGIDESERYKYYSNKNKIVVKQVVNGNVKEEVASKDIYTIGDKQYVVYATFDDTEVDGDVIGVFESVNDFVKWFMKTVGDIEAVSRIVNENDIRTRYPLMLTKNKDFIISQIKAYQEIESYYLKYLGLVFPDIPYGLGGRHYFLFFLSYIDLFIKQNGYTESHKNLLELVQSKLDKYLDKIGQNRNVRYTKEDIFEVVDLLNKSIIENTNGFGDKIKKDIFDRVDSVLEQIDKPSSYDIKQYNIFVSSLYNVYYASKKEEDSINYDFLISYLKDNIDFVFINSFDLIRSELEKDHVLVNNVEAALTSIKATKRSELVFGYMLFMLMQSFSAYTLYDLSLERRSRSTKVYTKEQNIVEAVIEYFETKNTYGPQLSLGVLLSLLESYRSLYGKSEEDLVFSISEDKAVKVSHVVLDKLMSILLKNDIKRFSFGNLENYHTNAMKVNSLYSLVSYYYDFLNSKFTLFTTTLYPHQSRAINKIIRAYQKGNDGFILSHATGSGKTITISKTIADIIEYRKTKYDLDTRVLFVSKSEVIEKISQEMVYYIPDKRMVIPNSSKDLDDLIRKGLPDILGISFRLLALYLSDDIVLENKEELGIDGNVSLDDTTQEESQQTSEWLDVEGVSENEEDEEGIRKGLTGYIKKKLKINLKEKQEKTNNISSRTNIDRLKTILGHYNIIVVDEAHYIKNAYVIDQYKTGSIFRVKDYQNKYSNLPDITDLGFYYVGNSSKIASLFLYNYLEYAKQRYANNWSEEELEKNRKFMIISTGTLLANWPQESWLLFYLTGAYHSGDVNTNKFLIGLTDFAHFASYFGNVKEQSKVFDAIKQKIESEGLTVSEDLILQEFERILTSTSTGSRGSSSKGIGIYAIDTDLNISDFKSLMNYLVDNDFMDIFTEKDAFSLGLLTEPKKSIIRVNISNMLSELNTSYVSLINERYDYVSDYDEILDLVKEYIKVFYQQTKGKKSKSIKIQDTTNQFKQSIIEFLSDDNDIVKAISDYIKFYLRYNQVSNVDSVHEEFMEGLETVLEGNRFEYRRNNLDIEIPFENYLYIDENKDSSGEDGGVKFSLKRVIDDIKEFLDVIFSMYGQTNYNHLMLNLNVALPFIFYDMIVKWVECDNGVRLGTGKSFIVVEHVKWGKYVFYSVAEFIYNIMKSVKEDRAINLTELINTCTMNYTISSVSNLAVSHNYLSFHPTFYSVLTSILSNVVDVLVDIKNDIDKSDVSNTSVTIVESLVRSLYKLVLLKRSLAFVLSTMIRIKQKDITEYVDKYMISYFYNKYGEDFFTFGRYLNSYFGGLVIKDENDSMNLLRRLDKNELNIAKQYESLHDYLLANGLISKNLHGIINNIISKSLSLQSKMFSDVNVESNSMINRIFKYKTQGVGDVKMSLSSNFMNNPDMRVILANVKSIAEGLNFKGGTVMYIIDFGYSVGLLSQVEARINRLGNKNPIDVYYVLSDIDLDTRRTRYIFYKDIVSAYVGLNSKNIYVALMNNDIDPISEVSKSKIEKTITTLSKKYSSSASVKVDYIRTSSGDKLVFYTQSTDNIQKAVYDHIMSKSDDIPSQTQDIGKEDDDVDIILD